LSFHSNDDALFDSSNIATQPFLSFTNQCNTFRCFDLSLRQRNSEWGIRDLEMVIEEAQRYGLEFIESIEMPANNLCVLFRKI
jgi:hypothetical protein